MGASASASANSIVHNPLGNKTSMTIDQFLKNEKEKVNKSIKLLLLGPPESGKSTLAKQIRIIYDHDFEEPERLQYRQIILHNFLDILIFVKTFLDDQQIDLDKDSQLLFDDISNINIGDVEKLISRQSSITRFLSSSVYHNCMTRQWEYDFPSSTSYFAENADRILCSSYVPSNQDILRARVHTNGLHETSFKFKGFEFTMFDIGQRSDPRKWISYFDNVSALIYTVDISSYTIESTDEIHGTKNHLQESFNLFQSVINNPAFSNTTSIVFLNKQDLFRQKIQHIPLHKCFPQYNGSDDYQETSKYLQRQFAETNIEGREMYIHLTVATDSTNIQCLFDTVISIILEHGQTSASLY